MKFQKLKVHFLSRYRIFTVTVYVKQNKAEYETGMNRDNSLFSQANYSNEEVEVFKLFFFTKKIGSRYALDFGETWSAQRWKNFKNF